MTGESVIRVVLGAVLAVAVPTAGMSQGETNSSNGQTSDRLKLPSPSSTSPKNPKQQIKMLQKELQTVGQKLQTAQNNALEHEELQKALTEFNQQAKEEMLRLAPEREKKVERRFEVFQQLIDLQKGGEMTEPKRKKLQSTAQEFQKLRKSLRDVEKMAAASEAVSKKQKAYQEALMAAMKKENENVPQLLKQRQALLRQYRRMQLKLRSQQQQQQQQQPQVPQTSEDTESPQSDN